MVETGHATVVNGEKLWKNNQSCSYDLNTGYGREENVTAEN